MFEAPSVGWGATHGLRSCHCSMTSSVDRKVIPHGLSRARSSVGFSSEASVAQVFPLPLFSAMPALAFRRRKARPHAVRMATDLVSRFTLCGMCVESLVCPFACVALHGNEPSAIPFRSLVGQGKKQRGVSLATMMYVSACSLTDAS